MSPESVLPTELQQREPASCILLPTLASSALATAQTGLYVGYKVIKSEEHELPMQTWGSCGSNDTSFSPEHTRVFWKTLERELLCTVQ